LTKLKEIVSFHSKHGKPESVLSELQESTVQILQAESSSIRLVAVTSTIAASYIATNQVSKATKLTQELYYHVVMKDTINVKSTQFNLTSKGRQILIFLAQLEQSLCQRRSTITKIVTYRHRLRVRTETRPLQDGPNLQPRAMEYTHHPSWCECRCRLHVRTETRPL
jgi:predicted transcriptional regulator